MTPRKILLIQGHPDNAQRHLCHGLEGAYAEGARTAGHAVRCVDVATLDFPLLRSQQEWELGSVGARGGDDWDAGHPIPLVFPCPQHQVP